MLERPQNIRPEYFKLTIGLMNQWVAKKIDENKFYELLYAAERDEFGLNIHRPLPLPTKPMLMDEKEPGAKEENMRRMYGYNMAKDRIELSNKYDLDRLKTVILPAFQRMGCTKEVMECRELIAEHSGTTVETQEWWKREGF